MNENNDNNDYNSILYEPVHKLLNYSVHVHEEDPEEEMFIQYFVNGKLYNITILVQDVEDEVTIQ